MSCFALPNGEIITLNLFWILNRVGMQRRRPSRKVNPEPRSVRNVVLDIPIGGGEVIRPPPPLVDALHRAGRGVEDEIETSGQWKTRPRPEKVPGCQRLEEVMLPQD